MLISWSLQVERTVHILGFHRKYIDVLPFTIIMNANTKHERIYIFTINRSDKGFHIGYIFDGGYLCFMDTDYEIISEHEYFDTCIRNMYFSLSKALIIDKDGFVRDELQSMTVN